MSVVLPSCSARTRRWLVPLLLIVLALAGWRLFFGGGRQGMPAGAAPVRVAVAATQDVPQFCNGLGTVLPSSDVLVTSRVDGQLLRLHFTEGQRVKAGDLLAEIDPRPFQASLDQALGTLTKDQAQLDNARKDLRRYAQLSKGDFIAAQQYETQRALVRQYEGTVAADKAAADAARLQLEYSRVTAPVSGRLGLRNVDEGNMIKSSSAEGLVRITEVSPCDVVFTLPESQVPLVVRALRRSEEEGSGPLPVQAWDREQKAQLGLGRLVSMDNQIDTSTGTVKLKASFPNADEALYPNQFVNARLLVRVLRGAVTVPASAVQLGTRGSYVYVLQAAESAAAPAAGKNGAAAPLAAKAAPAPRPGAAKEGTAPHNAVKTAAVSLRLITVGLTTDSLAVVEKGLAAGETVVVDGLDRLRDGSRVTVAASVPAPRAEAVPGLPPTP
ncbi:MdtA/MuxA family multidrug efflux RND transporter periplasmic adaptor subunit [Desulfovibrio legallii]|uniref:Membrane fusion protein, multidrug efflux system n=1 Tax=Desulfovibrio legallii TaxID=571438 RepID=A0A1G7KXG6_9BACT|nr:MdtA/MuxA family multidrug efflux RND transporter periplasmic adaptor subunit [Desulfovibrio legallii]SDF41883.1 membrane fusion protein, multidrug efflux system [Desulfovibrio legallii]